MSVIPTNLFRSLLLYSGSLSRLVNVEHEQKKNSDVVSSTDMFFGLGFVISKSHETGD